MRRQLRQQLYAASGGISLIGSVSFLSENSIRFRYERKHERIPSILIAPFAAILIERLLQ